MVLSALDVGETQASTRLVFPKSLTEIYGNTTSYSYGPGFIQFNGATWLDSRAFLANVTRVGTCNFGM